MNKLKGHNYRPEDECWQIVEGDELDRELDAALAKYAAVEPRVGIEKRVLANLRAQQSRNSAYGWWPWRVVLALAAAIVVLGLFLVFRSAYQKQFAVHSLSSPTTRHEAAPGGTHAAVRQIPVKKRSVRTAYHSPTVLAAGPRLEQFPSPQPLSEQEKILENYLANYPEHALLIAEARARALRQDAAEEAQLGGAMMEKDSQR